MTNPFDDENIDYRVLINDEGQYCIWPDFVAVPEGWTTVHGPGPRQSAVDHVEEHWTDMRPSSLVLH